MIPDTGPHILARVEFGGRVVYLLGCQKCEYAWSPRYDTLPEVCPKCKSHAFHVPKVLGKGRPKKDKIMIFESPCSYCGKDHSMEDGTVVLKCQQSRGIVTVDASAAEAETEQAAVNESVPPENS